MRALDWAIRNKVGVIRQRRRRPFLERVGGSSRDLEYWRTALPSTKAEITMNRTTYTLTPSARERREPPRILLPTEIADGA